MKYIIIVLCLVLFMFVNPALSADEQNGSGISYEELMLIQNPMFFAPWPDTGMAVGEVIKHPFMENVYGFGVLIIKPVGDHLMKYSEFVVQEVTDENIRNE